MRFVMTPLLRLAIRDATAIAERTGIAQRVFCDNRGRFHWKAASLLFLGETVCVIDPNGEPNWEAT